MVGRSLTDLEIADCFNAGLGRSHRTRLLGGAPEPLYEPARAGGDAVIRYTRDYATSALHELAHWCLAGARRRALPDYGYWYRPPPRTDAEQAAFFRVELPVQALEARLADAAGIRFRVSVDDLDRVQSAASLAAAAEFEAAVQARAAAAAAGERRFPARAEALQAELAGYRAGVRAA